MVASHFKLRMFFLYNKVIQILLLWKFVAETYSVIVNTETNYHFTIGLFLFQSNCQFVVMVAYFLCFAPNRLPCFVESRSFTIYKFKTVH